MVLQVHIWSDVVCPWCFVGKRRFEQALAEFGRDVQVIWHSFELDLGNSYGPRHPKTLAERLAQKYGMSLLQAEAKIDQMTKTGLTENIHFSLRESKTLQTFDAHRLLHFARKHGLQDALKERLLVAHFCEGIDCGDPSELLRISSAVGLDANAASGVLHGDLFSQDVRDDEQAARELGITGVPFFVIGRYGISGAQPKDVLRSALNRAFLESQQQESPPEATHTEGAVCTESGC